MRARILSAAIVLAFTAPAFAQVNLAIPNAKYQTQEEVDQAIKRDQDYKATMQKLPDQKTSNDPWGNVRSTTPAADQKTKKNKASTE